LRAGRAAYRRHADLGLRQRRAVEAAVACLDGHFALTRRVTLAARHVAGVPLPAFFDLAVDNDAGVALLLVADGVVGLTAGEVGLVRGVRGHKGAGQHGRFHNERFCARKRERQEVSSV